MQYMRTAVARKRKGRMGKPRGTGGLSIKASGPKQPLGAHSLSTKPIDSLQRQKWGLMK